MNKILIIGDYAMKKIISAVLFLALCISCFAGCAPKEDAGLNAAAEYLYSMYKDSGVVTNVDYTVVSQVRIDDVTYPITWTVDVAEDVVKITEGENATVIVDVNENSTEEVNYKLTATLANEAGLTVTVSFDHTVPKVPTYQEIVDMAYALKAGDTLDGTYTLKGVINSINTAWSDEYSNITVTIDVEGVEGKPIMCYRLKGEGAKDLKVGDTITVRGAIKNYNGTVEFDAGCELLAVVAGEGGGEEAPAFDPTGKTQDEIIDAAYELEIGKAMAAEATLTGVISEVKTAWSDQYSNITVVIKCAGKEDKPIDCFRLKGDGAKDLKVGDTITVKGTLKNYNGTVEFDAGCTLESVTAGAGGNTPTTTTPPATNPPATTPPATKPPVTNPPSASNGASVTFDFSSLTDKGAELTENAMTVISGAASGSGLVSVTTTKVYSGNGNGGAYPSTAGFLKLGTGDTDGALEMTFSKKVAKVEIVCHDWYAKSEKYPTNSNTVSVNGSEAQLAPYTTDGTVGTLTFNLASASEKVSIALDNTQGEGKSGRVFIFKIIVTFA